jgi:Tol biopolymer transport system component
VRLTEPGCCVQPFWSPDGSRILFIDKPSADSPSGLYSVNPDQPGSAPEFFSPRPGLYSSDMSLVAYPENGLAVVEDVETGERWEVNTNGNAPAFSPDGLSLLWQAGGGGGGGGTNRPTDVYLAHADGSDAHVVTTIVGGNVSAWFPDSRRLLVTTRPAANSFERVLSVFDLADGSLRELVRGDRISSLRISKDGAWVAFFVAFSANSVDDGIWLVRTDGGDKKRLEEFGAYQWRDDGRLLLIPMEPGQGSHVLWEVEAATGAARPLTDPAVTPFKVANGDWAVSPDGSRIAFVSAADHAVWLLRLQ